MFNFIYVHGLNSSSHSSTGKRLAEALPEHNVISLDWDSREFFSINIESLIASVKNLNKNNFIFVGTSMGGLYASILARYFYKASILFNPVVEPVCLLKNMRKKNPVFTLFSTGETYTISDNVIDSYKEVPDVRDFGLPVSVVLGAQDELLDPHIAEYYWKGYSHIELCPNIQHRITDFHQFRDMLLCDIYHPFTD